jgi:hypothetical protein
MASPLGKLLNVNQLGVQEGLRANLQSMLMHRDLARFCDSEMIAAMPGAEQRLADKIGEEASPLPQGLFADRAASPLPGAGRGRPQAVKTAPSETHHRWSIPLNHSGSDAIIGRLGDGVGDRQDGSDR